MFSHVKEFFLGDTSIAIDGSGRPSSTDLQTATLVLLLKMAISDHDVVLEEVQAIYATMSKQFDVREEDTEELIAIGNAALERSEKIGDFVALLNSEFNEEQRALVYGMLWRVVIADGKVDTYEAALANELRAELSLDGERALAARAAAERGEI